MPPDPPRNYAAAFTPGLLAPTRPVPAHITAPPGSDALGEAVASRYNVYRNNVTVSLIAALTAIYPAVRRLTGEDFFRAMARQHLRATPPCSPLLFEYGRNFPAFIARYPHARAMPWLADIARIERAWLDAYHAADAEPLGPAALADVAPERLPGLRFVSHPAVRLVSSDYPAVTIFAMNRGSDFVGPLRTAGAEDALITRPALEVTVRHLPPGATPFLSSLIVGESLAMAAERGFTAAPAFDLPACLACMLEAGVFTRILFGD